ncbi:hypothetical protein J2848_001058 [Azospirillum lipoferum]|uniref:Uncharacterized protein n=1 Tax=Azospirillum lipoferum TaxID=193 RepID=A0A5A9GVW0_AZOLI|nr:MULTISPECIES: hypothetical protein [Azospirillum]KAA0598576.1 hypothetical protein FZ942_05760 [Azospirillum lipoferum]MBY6266175.1 hypothetical protein [Azospirillum sp. 412522]MCP1609411.1 hypothetical protein [Azospirillum lipoferum]MDW5535280.1 hypothetical protein [Azospirillum sp. NL1]
MIGAVNSKKINASSVAHIALLDQFIRLTQDTIVEQDDAFVRDSLVDLLSNLRNERADYAEIIGAIALNRAV